MINSKSLANLEKARAARAKPGAKFCGFTLRPETIQRLKMLPNKSGVIDKMVAYIWTHGLAHTIFFEDTHDGDVLKWSLEDKDKLIQQLQAKLTDAHYKLESLEFCHGRELLKIKSEARHEKSILERDVKSLREQNSRLRSQLFS